MQTLKLFVLATIAASVVATAEKHAAEQVDDVVRTADGTVVGESSLYRFDNRIHAITRTSDLNPGSAVTVWWRIYNRPRFCAVPFACEASDLDNPDVDGSQLHATATVVGHADGTAIVVSTLYRGAVKAQGGEPIGESFDEGHLKGRGLRRPLNAEVELLFASHGRVADPALDGEQAALEQLLTPVGTQLDCVDPNNPSAGRSYRCGVIQKVNHARPY